MLSIIIHRPHVYLHLAAPRLLLFPKASASIGRPSWAAGSPYPTYDMCSTQGGVLTRQVPEDGPDDLHDAVLQTDFFLFVQALKRAVAAGEQVHKHGPVLLELLDLFEEKLEVRHAGIEARRLQQTPHDDGLVDGQVRVR
eukprot:1187069-Prorocentrum_minimum.AAC.1